MTQEPTDALANAREATDREIAEHLLRTHHQWRPNKDADRWVSSACYLIRTALEAGVFDLDMRATPKEK